MCPDWARDGEFAKNASATVTNPSKKTVPLFIKSAFGWSEGEAGLVFLAAFVPSLLSTLFARLKPRWPVSIAFIAMALLYVALSFTTSDTTPIKVLFCLLMLGIGVCFFLITTVHMSAVSVIASESENRDRDENSSRRRTTSSGKAFALMSQALAAGLLMGPLWAGPLDARFGWLPMCVSFAGINLLSGGLVAFCWKDGRTHGT